MENLLLFSILNKVQTNVIEICCKARKANFVTFER